MFGNIIREIKELVTGRPRMWSSTDIPLPSGGRIHLETYLRTAAFPSQYISYHVLAEFEASFANLKRSVGQEERPLIDEMEAIHQRHFAPLRNGGLAIKLDGPPGEFEPYDPAAAIAYYESTGRSKRVGPHPIDLKAFKGEAKERRRSIENLRAIMKDFANCYRATAAVEQFETLLSKLEGKH